MLKPRCLQSALVIVVAIATVFAYQGGHKGKEENLRPGNGILWIDPGDPSSFDFRYGVGGSERQPRPPFRFVNEDMSGTQPKINVTDALGVAWNVKWGPEASPSTFCTRLVGACGYFVVPEFFVASGRVDGAHGLSRAQSYVSEDGSFVNARFQMRTESPRFLDGYSWTWVSNPFLHTHELRGLKILMLLVSNWDAKDARDVMEGRLDSNLAIYADDSTGERHYLFANNDWGATLGKWGNNLTWNRWNCKGFAEQTPHFVKSAENGRLNWGFKGKHRKDMTADISVYDVQWLLQYLGRITDAQIRQGLESSGATPEETECFGKALRRRIEKLRQAATQIPPHPTKPSAP